MLGLQNDHGKKHDVSSKRIRSKKNQSWPEQTRTQIEFLEAEAKANGISTGSPLYYVLKYPFDPILLLAYLGIPYNIMKLEMKCSGGGINPISIDESRFESFLSSKIHDVRECLCHKDPVFIDGSDILQRSDALEEFERLIPKMQQLKGSKDFTSGSFSQ